MKHNAAGSMRGERTTGVRAAGPALADTTPATHNQSSPSLIRRQIDDHSPAGSLGLDLQEQPEQAQERDNKVISIDDPVDRIYITVNDVFFGNFSIDEWDPITIKTDQFLSLYPSAEERNQGARGDLTKLTNKSHEPVFFVGIDSADGERHAETFDPKKHDRITIQAPKQTVADAALGFAEVTNVSKISQVSWGETSGIYPSSQNLYDPSQWDALVIQELLKARAAMEIIAGRNSKLRKDTPDIKKTIIKRLAPYHLKDNFPSVDSEILGNKDVKYFYLSPDPEARHTGINDTQRIVKRYGPFYNAGGGDVPRGKCYIIFYAATN